MTTLMLVLLAAAADSGAPVAWAPKEITWVEAPAVPGAQMAVLWGDPPKEASGTMKRFLRGSDIPFHKHSADQRTVVMSGHLALRIGTDPAKELGPGSYIFIPAGTPHGAICRRDEDCVVYEEMTGPSDFIKVDALAVASAPPAAAPATRAAGNPGSAPAPTSRRTRQDKQNAAAAATLLGQRFPEAEWSAENSASAELDGDGAEDVALVGRAGVDVWVGIASGPLGEASRRWTLRFPVDGKRQDGLCDGNVTLTTEPLELPAAELGCGPQVATDKCREMRERSDRLKALAGKGAKGLRLESPGCDAFHLYWDPAGANYRWWRR
jgi:quercetin dioxygenase-like cupin family protein